MMMMMMMMMIIIIIITIIIIIIIIIIILSFMVHELKANSVLHMVLVKSSFMTQFKGEIATFL